jgi:hypothetical protein
MIVCPADRTKRIDTVSLCECHVYGGIWSIEKGSGLDMTRNGPLVQGI